MFFIAAASLAAATAVAADLTTAEARWLQASAPVLEYARHHHMPLDVMFEHHAQPGAAPLSVGFDGGRCHLVYAIRGNPEADTALAQAEADLVQPVIEAMVAHELGHCWRYIHGGWYTLPAGFMPGRDADRDPARARLRRDMRLARLEEGYADLVGLAWTQLRHPTLYARIHEWFCRVRDAQPVPGAHHDTAAWIQLVKEPASFRHGETPFEQALPLWREGLRAVK